MCRAQAYKKKKKKPARSRTLYHNRSSYQTLLLSERQTLLRNKKSTWSHHAGIDILARKIQKTNANIFTFPDSQLLTGYIQIYYLGRDFPRRERQHLVFLLERLSLTDSPDVSKTQVYTWLKSAARIRREREDRCKKQQCLHLISQRLPFLQLKAKVTFSSPLENWEGCSWWLETSGQEAGDTFPHSTGEPA